MSLSDGKQMIRTTQHAPSSLQPSTKRDHPNSGTLYCCSSTIFYITYLFCTSILIQFSLHTSARYNGILNSSVYFSYPYFIVLWFESGAAYFVSPRSSIFPSKNIKLTWVHISIEPIGISTNSCS
jgi:hypothetical protein